MKKTAGIIFLSGFYITIYAGSFASKLHPVIQRATARLAGHGATVTQAAKRGIQSVGDKTVIDIVDKTVGIIKPVVKAVAVQKKPAHFQLRTSNVKPLLTPGQQLKKEHEESARILDSDLIDSSVGLAAILNADAKASVIHQSALSLRDAQAPSVVDGEAGAADDATDDATNSYEADTER